MVLLAVRSMGRRLTVPFGRGADTLTLTLDAVDATEAPVAAYNFREHQALYNTLPAARYVLTAHQDVVAATTLTVEYRVLDPFGVPGPVQSVTVDVPAGSVAGSSFAVNLGPDEGPSARLVRIASDPPAAPAGPLTVADAWEATALLGNLARLHWVLGVERDQLRRYLDAALAQRRLEGASRVSLDWIGFDRGVPRFPPRPYSFDRQFTIALYHLDDVPPTGQPSVAQVEDIAVRYTGAGHPGQNVGLRAQHGAVGRFGNAFVFRDPNAELRVADHPDFALPVADSFTVECFVRPEPEPPPAVQPAEGHVVAKHADPANPNQPGWALSVGHFGRGIPFNARFLVSDGVAQAVLFADVQLSDDRFHHLAGVVDRAAREARLYVDGRLVRSAPIGVLGALTSPSPLQIGRAGAAPFRGVVDEVRLSQVALGLFAPALGEDDEAYRRRLRIFQHWTLPTPAALALVLNEAAGPIGGNPAALEVDDAPSTLIGGTHLVTVFPQLLAAGERIDALGNKRADEALASGTVAGETGFEPSYLLTSNEAGVVYVPPAPRTLAPRELPPDPHKMQLVTERCLRRLIALLAALGVGGQLRVVSAFDPRAGDLRAVGRGLLLQHTTGGIGVLGALAHRAGFSFVTRREPENAVYASVAAGAYVEIVVAPGGTAVSGNGFDARPGETLNLEIRPPLPADTLYRWTTIACGAGQGQLTTPVDRAAVTLEVTQPGDLPVKVEVTRNRRPASATRTFRIGLADLPNNQSIGADGSLGVEESVAGGREAFLHPAYLVTHDDPRANYGPDLNRRRMQPSVARRLTRLLDLIAATGTPGQLDVLEAFAPAAPDVRAQGRGLTLQHPNAGMPPGRLGALAHAAGFTYVRRSVGQIRVRQATDELVTISGPQEVAEGSSIPLAVSPRANPRGMVARAGAVYVANSGTDSVSEIDPLTGRVRRAVKVERTPVALALNVNGSRLYVANRGSNTVSEIDTATLMVTATVTVGQEPVALVHHPAQPRLFVALRTANALRELSTAPFSLGVALPLGVRPVGLAVRSNGAEIWVASDLGQRIVVVTTAPLAAAATIALAGQPADVAIAQNSARAYATLPAARSVVLLDVATRTVTATVGTGPSPTGAPRAVAVSGDSAAVAVADADPAGERIHLFQANGTARATLRIGADPADLLFDGGRIYVANGGDDTVSVVEVGAGPAGPAVLTNAWRLGSGLGEHLSWVTRASGGAQARLNSTTRPAVSLAGEQAGRLLARAIYDLGDRNDPYTFQVRLTPAVAANPAVTISKEQYDLIMNILNALHPIGVEVRTQAIRERVVEVRDDLLSAFPDYTYPNFRVRGPLPHRPPSPKP